MTPEEINRLAGSIFRSSVPRSWGTMLSREDRGGCGTDYEIALTTPSDQPTGMVFTVQQRGSENLFVVESGAAVAFNGLSVNSMRDCLYQSKIPVVLMVVDVLTEDAYWIVLQGDPDIERAYKEAVASGATILTVHVPMANHFPDTTDKLLEAVASCGNRLSRVEGAREGFPVKRSISVAESSPTTCPCDTARAMSAVNRHVPRLAISR